MKKFICLILFLTGTSIFADTADDIMTALNDRSYKVRKEALKKAEELSYDDLAFLIRRLKASRESRLRLSAGRLKSLLQKKEAEKNKPAPRPTKFLPLRADMELFFNNSQIPYVENAFALMIEDKGGQNRNTTTELYEVLINGKKVDISKLKRGYRGSGKSNGTTWRQPFGEAGFFPTRAGQYRCEFIFKVGQDYYKTKARTLSIELNAQDAAALKDLFRLGIVKAMQKKLVVPELKDERINYKALDLFIKKHPESAYCRLIRQHLNQTLSYLYFYSNLATELDCRELIKILAKCHSIKELFKSIKHCESSIESRLKAARLSKNQSDIKKYERLTKLYTACRKECQRQQTLLFKNPAIANNSSNPNRIIPTPKGVYMRKPKSILPFQETQLYLVDPSNKKKKNSSMLRIDIAEILINGKPVDITEINLLRNGQNNDTVVWFQHFGRHGLFPRKPGKYSMQFTFSTPEGCWKMDPFDLEVRLPDNEKAAYGELQASGITQFFSRKLALPKKANEILPYRQAGSFMRKYPKSIFTRWARKQLLTAIEDLDLWENTATQADLRELMKVLVVQINSTKLKKTLDQELKSQQNSLKRAHERGDKAYAAQYDKFIQLTHYCLDHLKSWQASRKN